MMQIEQEKIDIVTMYSCRYSYSNSSIIVSANAGTYANPNNNNTQDQVALTEYNRNLNFRVEFGLSTDTDHINKTMRSVKPNKIFGVSLTAEEESDLNQRMNRQEKIPSILDYVQRNYSEKVAGVFIDQQQGGNINIGFKSPVDQGITKAIENYSNESGHIKVIQVKYSYEELVSLSEAIQKSINELKEAGVEIVEVSPVFKKQKVDVGISVNNQKNREMLFSEFDHEMINVYEAQPWKVTVDRAEDKYRPVPAGVQGNFNGSGFCTFGFSAKDASNKYYLISAGHCNGGGANQIVYQPGFPGCITMK